MSGKILYTPPKKKASYTPVYIPLLRGIPCVIELKLMFEMSESYLQAFCITDKTMN